VQKFKLLGFVLTAILLVFGCFKAKDFFAIDGCLDTGGRWNYQKRECEEFKFDPKVLSDQRFSSGRYYETKKSIPPKTFQFENYTIVTGYPSDNGVASLGLFYGNKQLFYTTAPDGFYDTVMVANLNNDGIMDFLVGIAYEDGGSLLGLTSVTKERYKERSLIDERYDAYCIESSDTTKHILPLQIKDINYDGKDDIIANLCALTVRYSLFPVQTPRLENRKTTPNMGFAKAGRQCYTSVSTFN
jgi:hypothetical protein